MERRPENWGNQEVPSPPPKKSGADSARNSVARVAAQIRTGQAVGRSPPLDTLAGEPPLLVLQRPEAHDPLARTSPPQRGLPGS